MKRSRSACTAFTKKPLLLRTSESRWWPHTVAASSTRLGATVSAAEMLIRVGRARAAPQSSVRLIVLIGNKRAMAAGAAPSAEATLLLCVSKLALSSTSTRGGNSLRRRPNVAVAADLPTLLLVPSPLRQGHSRDCRARSTASSPPRGSLPSSASACWLHLVTTLSLVFAAGHATQNMTEAMFSVNSSIKPVTLLSLSDSHRSYNSPVAVTVAKFTPCPVLNKGGTVAKYWAWL